MQISNGPFLFHHLLHFLNDTPNPVLQGLNLLRLCLVQPLIVRGGAESSAHPFFSALLMMAG